MKKIEPGKPCIIKGSRWNDGRIVTPVKYLGIIEWIDSFTGKEFKAGCWKLAEELVIPAGSPGPADNKYLCLESTLFPLDNPGDDEADMFPLSRSLTRAS